MKKIHIYFMLVLQLLIVQSLNAQTGQCLGGGCSTGVAWGATQSTTSATFVNSVAGTWGGEYNTYNVTSGQQYEWSLCPTDGAIVGTNTDSQLSLRRNDNNVALCYSDDFCGAHAKILWTATFTGVVRVYVHRYNCQSLGTSHTVRWRCVSCGPPPNPCAAAIDVPSLPVNNQSVVCSSSNNLNSSNVPACGGASTSYMGGNEALYTITPTTSGPYTISYNGQTWSSIWVWANACPASGGTCVGSVGSSASAQTLNVNLTAGVTYYVMFDTWPSPVSPCPGTFSITAPVPPPANDLCSGAIALSCGGTVTVNTTNATTDAVGSSFCGTTITTPGVWYQITGNGQQMTVSTVGLTGADTKLIVYSGSCAGLTCVGGNDDFSGLQSSVTWNSVSGTTYYVLAALFSGTGSFPMSLSCVTPVPSNPTGITVSETSGVSNNDGITCSGASVTLTASGAVGTVYWFTGSCATTGQIATGNSITVNPTTTTNYFARNFSGGQWSVGCASTTITVNANPTVSATANPATICVGQSSQLEAVVEGASAPGTLVVTISNAGWMDEVSWTLTNSLGATIGSGGPYGLGGSNSSTIGSSANGPYTFNLETQGTFNDNIADYVITCNGATVLSGTLTGGLTTSQSVSACVTAPTVSYAWTPSATLSNAGIVNPLASPSANTTYTASVIVNGCQGSGQTNITVNNPTLAIPPANGDMVWRGASDTDWAILGNWWQYNGTAYVAASAAPTTAQNVIIPANQACVLNQPNTNANAGNAKNLRIESGATLTMTTGSLIVTENWVNNGTFTPGTGTVSFTGSGTHTISGISGAHNFHNLTMNKDGEVQLSVPIAMSGALTLTNGRLNIGNFNLDLPTNTINGGNANSYVRTTGTGVLMRNVGASMVNFPVGRSAYNPTSLANSGTLDKFNVRVIDNVTDDGTAVAATTLMAVVNRTWMINEQVAGGSNVTLRLQWNGMPEEINNFAEISSFVAHFIAGEGLWDNIGGTVQSAGVIQTSGITSFSPFTVSSDNAFAPLPVELIAFTAHCQNEDVEVKWSTASEFNSQHYVLQVSEDGYSWSDLYVIEAAGFSTTVLEYSYIHKNAARTKNYYRLRQYDNDGTVETYNTIMSNCTSDEYVFMTFPNPSADAFTVLVNDKLLSGSNVLNISDASGKLIYSIAVDLENGSGSFEVEGLNLSAGLYYLQLNNGLYASRIIKHSFR